MTQPTKKLDPARLGAALFELAPFPVSIIDRDFHIVLANAAFAEAYGEWQGGHCYEVFKRQHRPCSECVTCKTFEDACTHVTEERGVNKAGESTVVEMKTAPILDDDGSVEYVMETAVDISRLRDMERQYQLLFERVPCYITTLDSDLRIVDSNWRHREAFGDVRGKHCYEVYMRADDACESCPVLETFDDGRVHVERRTVLDKKGDDIHFIVHSAPIYDRHGAITGAIEMATDITSMVEMQDQLIEAETDAAMSRAMSMVAVTTRQLRSGLDEGIARLRRGLERSDTAAVATAVDWLGERADHLACMLAVAERRRQGAAAPARVSPAALVDRAVGSFADRPESTRIGVRGRVADGLDDVLVDEATATDCLGCLISSFMEVCVPEPAATDERYVLVEARAGRPGAVDIDVGIGGIAAVSDAGDGRAESSPRDQSALSMSLLLVQRTIEEQGGTVRFATRADRGITFEVTLPVARAGDGQ